MKKQNQLISALKKYNAITIFFFLDSKFIGKKSSKISLTDAATNNLESFFVGIVYSVEKRITQICAYNLVAQLKSLTKLVNRRTHLSLTISMLHTFYTSWHILDGVRYNPIMFVYFIQCFFRQNTRRYRRLNQELLES